MSIEIIEKRRLNATMTALTLLHPGIARKAQAGQFVILRADNFGERIPLTIADADAQTGLITVIFQIVGRTTMILESLSAGDFIADCAGPLGNATHFGDAKNICVVGGGVGTAIAFPVAKAAFHAGIDTDVIAGFRSKDLVILENELFLSCDRLFLTTDDGSYGEAGFVTDKLKTLIDSEGAYDLVVAIGPVPMMKAVCQTTKPYGIKTLVSLNPIMIDGTGMCGCCRVTVGGAVKFACVDGPDFDGHAVDFDELAFRNRAYAERERHDREHCRLFNQKPGEGDSHG
jgi:ferredoxin--NADP+ reductase